MAANPVKQLHVAVGVILNPQKKILIALRPKKTHQGGLWEFPGGKVEQDETIQQALYRELKEELGLLTVSSRPLLKIQHDYTDKSVLLDVWWVDGFNYDSSTADYHYGLEGQPLRWVDASELGDYKFPEANKKIIESVQRVLCSY